MQNNGEPFIAKDKYYHVNTARDFDSPMYNGIPINSIKGALIDIPIINSQGIKIGLFSKPETIENV